jgi:electron transport complex protein RnfB
MSIEENEIYHKLANHLRKMPIDFPPTQSGIEIKILKHYFTPQEAEVALLLGVLPEPLKVISRRLKGANMTISQEELEQILDGMVKKGSIAGGAMYADRGKGKYYGNLHLAVGMHEFHVDKQTKEYVEDLEQYMTEEFFKAFHNKEVPQMRTIPVEKSIETERYISNYNAIRKIIETIEEPIAVLNCVCKQGMDLLDQPCKQTDLREICIAFGKGALHLKNELGIGRFISKEELFKLLEKLEEDGLVLQPENSKNPSFICACCKCCCGVLRSVKLLDRPADYLAVNYYAIVDINLCKGCKTCLERCQMGAIKIEDGKASIDLNFCIGCGLCVIKCPTKAIQLKRKSKQKIPPKDMMDKYRKILIRRRGVLGTMKMAVDLLFGRRI